MPGFSINNSERDSINNKQEFFRTHRWMIEDLGFPQKATKAKNLASAGKFRLYAQSIVLPELSFETKPAPGASVDYPIAHKANFDAVSVKLYDIYKLHEAFEEWEKLIWTQEDGIKPINDYAGTVKFVLTDGNGEILRRYHLLNAFPKKVGHGELSYMSPDIKLLNVTYTFSHYKVEHLESAAIVASATPSATATAAAAAATRSIF